jgi:hypothetical protein
MRETEIERWLQQTSRGAIQHRSGARNRRCACLIMGGDTLARFTYRRIADGDGAALPQMPPRAAADAIANARVAAWPIPKARRVKTWPHRVGLPPSCR